MTRQEWNEIAAAIASVRARLKVRGARVMLVDRVADAVCRVLERRSSRFDRRIFLAVTRSRLRRG